MTPRLDDYDIASFMAGFDVSMCRCAVGTSLSPSVFPVWLFSHRELRTSLRVKTVFNLLAEALSR